MGRTIFASSASELWTFYGNFQRIIDKKYTFFFRAIFDLSNKIALLILLRMYALYVKKKQKFEQKFKIWLKSDIFSSV